MIIQSNGVSVQLRGLQPSLPAFSLIEVQLMSDNVEEFEDTKVLVQISQLLQTFSDLFQEPTELPPSRSCDHSIPLIQGAQPVNIRPYRFSPAMKTEIEIQVQDMLSKGIIQSSQSAFSSPVLLVKKKDKSLCFCVDYRHLNALTVKCKYPVHVIDVLLDELLGFQAWISELGLTKYCSKQEKNIRQHFRLI
jgi:hypothetical protein